MSIAEVKQINSRSSTFSFVLSSKIEQNVKLHIAAEQNKIRLVECNGTKIVFPYKPQQWFEGPGEEVSLSLKKGVNNCTVYTDNFGKVYTPAIKQKITFLDYCILFSLLGVPLYGVLFTVFIGGINLIKRRIPAASCRLDKYGGNKSEPTRLLLVILLAGAAIRVLYFEKFGITLFQHDWHGHIEFIKYIAQNWTLPLPSKGLEYPQQPLYYLLSGGVHALSTHVGFDEGEALYAVGYFSLLCSMFFLYYAYRFMVLVIQSTWVRSVAIVFISLTPSLVYLGARINNDSLVMALGAFSLYYSVKSYQSGFEKSFYTALTGVSLLFMTKISAAPMEVLLFALLILAYYRKKGQEATQVKKKLYWFGAVGLFLLGFTLLRVYAPVENAFHMVNSARFPNQTIGALDWGYFSTFYFKELLTAGQSYIFGEDAIRFSFLTYQYGTMFFGEFDYSYFLEKSPYLKMAMQAVLLSGLLFVVGFVGYLLRLYREPLLHQLLFVTFLFNVVLVLKFMFSFPSVCNTDFRYFVGSFVLIGFIFAKGLEPIHTKRIVGKVFHSWLTLLTVSEIIFFVLLLTS
ncbi:MAG: hypothetical protein PHO65_04115 [Sulfurovum sp.]|nr:hypothetical protein [Sulfurovum sp.]